MNYYMLHECGMKKVDEKSYKAHKQYKDGTTKTVILSTGTMTAKTSFSAGQQLMKNM